MSTPSSARAVASKVKRRFVGQAAPKQSTPTFGVSAISSDRVAELTSMLKGSKWFKPAPVNRPAVGDNGIGNAPAVPVVVLGSDDGAGADAFSLARTAVLFVGERPEGREPSVWHSRTVAVEARQEAVALASQPELRDRVAHVQRRDSISRLGLVQDPAGVSMLVATNRPNQLATVLENAGRQTGVNAQLVLISHGWTPDPAALAAFGDAHPDVTVTTWEAPRDWTLGRCLNAGIERSEGDDIVKMDDDNYYGDRFLYDLSRDLRISGAQLTGKYAHYVHLEATDAVVLRHPDREHAWTHLVQGGGMYFDGAVLRRYGFSDIPRAVDTDVLTRLRADDGRIYSSDRFNFVSARRADTSVHTWNVADAQMLTPSGDLAFYGNPRVHVTI